MSQFSAADTRNGNDWNASNGTVSNSTANSDFDLALNGDWEALEGILFENEITDEDCIRINPISSNFSVSQQGPYCASNPLNMHIPYAPVSSFATTNISSYLQQQPQYHNSGTYGNFGYNNNFRAASDINQISYVGSAGSSKKSVDFEEFLKTPAARELLEGPPSYSFGSIGQLEGFTPPTRKMKRDEAYGYDDDCAEAIKAMRGGSLGRVIASSVAAASFADNDKNARLLSGDGRTLDPSILQQAVSGKIATSTNSNSCGTINNREQHLCKDEEKKQLVCTFFQRLNRCDIAGLVKIIRHCDEICVLSTPDVLEPIIGRSDIMMLISLLIEAYPDGVWTPSAITISGDIASCSYRFMGTRVFDHSINSLFRQIKTNIGSIIAASSQHHQIDFFSNSMDALRLVNGIAEGAVPTDSHYSQAPVVATDWQEKEQSAYDQYRLQQQQAQSMNNHPSSPRNCLQFSNPAIPCQNGDGNEPIMIRRHSRTLREVKAIETAVLEEGSTMYRRKLEFIFNADNEIIQIIFTNIL